MKVLLRKLVHSTYLDLFGALLILFVCISRDFHETFYFAGKIEFGVPISNLWEHISEGAFPLGILSTVGAVFSLLSTRLIGKQNNVGNAIGIATSISTGVIDFLFGNRSAVITYPVSLFLNSLSTYNWSKGETVKSRNRRYYGIFIFGLIIGTGLVYLGAYLFGGKTNHSFLVTVSISFGLSIGGNLANAYKYEETWVNWFFYNIVQLVKNIMLLNIANVAKYSFYLFNAAITYFDWVLNGDVERNQTDKLL